MGTSSAQKVLSVLVYGQDRYDLNVLSVVNSKTSGCYE